METNKQKKTGVAILIPDEIEFKIKPVTREKEGPSNSISGYLSEETQNTKSKRSMHHMFIAALFTIAKVWQQVVSINR